MPSAWNNKNPAIRRIFADIRELEALPSDQYAAKPLEDNMFDWHFTIRGPKGTDYEGGIYHGRITLPSDYPFKPPDIMLLTPNGRWEVKEKICLSTSSYHPEHWQPAWGIRTILEALICFMETPADGAVGALEYSPETRRQLALESQSYRHSLMPELPELRSEGEDTEESLALKHKYAQQVSQLHVHKLGTDNQDGNEESESVSVERTPSSAEQATSTRSQDVNSDARDATEEAQTGESGGRSAVEGNSEVQNDTATDSGLRRRGTHTTQAGYVAEVSTSSSTEGNESQGVTEQHGDWVDTTLGYLSVALFFGIIAVLYRKALATFGATG